MTITRRNKLSGITKINSDYLLLLLLTLVCYWPFTFQVFSAKNDNMIVVLPMRIQISEAIAAGHLPFWSPYIYLGFPLHGDMQSGCWNPVVWLLSIFTRYDITVLQIEILIYIFISGIGMYKLLRAFNFHRKILLSGSVAYLMCGFITDVGGSNILFLASAAFVPFVFLYYYRFLNNISVSNGIKTVFALSLLLVTGYPSFFILTAYILFTAMIVSIIRMYKLRSQTVTISRFLVSHILLIISFLLLCSPVIISYWQLLPYYDRGNGLPIQRSFDNSFHPLCSLSFLLPTAAIKNPESFSTDLISRNSYFNSLFLLFFFLSFPLKKSWTRYFLLAGILYFFLFSLGPFTPVRALSYHLPLLNTFRHPSNARLFVILACILFASFTLEDYRKGDFPAKKIIWIIYGLMLVTLVFLAAGLFSSTLFKEAQNFFGSGSSRAGLKNFLDGFTFYDALVINSLIQLGFFLWLMFYLRGHKMKIPVTAFLLNSFLFAQLCIPYTFSSKTSPSEINQVLHRFPDGFPAPSLVTTLEQNSSGITSDFRQIGLTSFYNKKPGMQPMAVTPTYMNVLKQLFADSVVQINTFRNSFAYLADTIIYRKYETGSTNLIKAVFVNNTPALGKLSRDSASIYLTKFSNDRCNFRTYSASAKILCLQQVNLPGWKAFLDGSDVKIFPANIAFMGIQIPPGSHKVEFRYQPLPVYYGLYMSIITMVLLFVLLLFHRKIK